jgi:short subunit dehydrogenase-like uncharacterized protein
VVTSAAGPFTFYGAPVIEAARDVGAHYCDTTGEAPYMQRVFEHMDAPASERGLAVVPAVGFDIVPGDLLAALAARGAGAVDEVVVAYAVTGFGMTRGTMHSALEMLRGEELEYADGAWGPARTRAVVREDFTYPDPIGEQAVTRFPGGEIVTVPRHVETRAVRGRMTVGSYAPHPAVAGAVPYAMPVLGALLGSPLRGPLNALIDRLPEGPAEDDRQAARWMIVADARSGATTSRAWASGTDMYGLTAVTAVELARTMGEDGFAGKGALAPAQVVDAEEFLAWLGDFGVTFEAPAAKRRGSSKTRGGAATKA